MAKAGDQRDALGLSDLGALKQEIVAEVESELLEALWRKGQGEIRKLRHEEEQLVSAVERLREQQEVMRKESREMQAALAQVTANFELVVHQMREAFRLFEPQLPQGVLMNHLSKDLSTEQSPLTEAWTPQRSPVSEGPPGLESRKATPPAAVLSLASALPPVNHNAVSACTRLQLAEILSHQASNVMDRPSDSSSQPSTPRQHCKVDTLQVTLIKDPGFTTLGMDVKKIQPGLLRVDGIDVHGLVGVHNARQTAPQSRILEGDRIREINGIKDDTELMLAECKSKQQLMITLERHTNVSRLENETMMGIDDATTVAKQRASQMRPDAEAFVPCSPLEFENRMPGLNVGHSVALLSSPPGMDAFHHDFQSLPLHSLGNPQPPAVEIASASMLAK